MNIKNFINRYKFITVLFYWTAFLLFLLCAATVGVNATPACGKCHTMTTYYSTWESSAHREVGCWRCHTGLNAISGIKSDGLAMKRAYAYFTDRYQLPIERKNSIPDRRCLGCHPLSAIKSSAKIKTSHPVWAAKGVGCVNCHTEIAHPTDKTPSMKLCMECHNQQALSTACKTCHSKEMKPETHKQKNFSGSHGKLVRGRVSFCDGCHVFTGGGQADTEEQAGEDIVGSTLDKIISGSGSNFIDYAKSNQFCVKCHKKKPASHGVDWPFAHSREAVKDPPKCTACHKVKANDKGVTQKVICSNCHPSGHYPRWRTGHPGAVPASNPIIGTTCFGCHDKDSCVMCHRATK